MTELSREVLRLFGFCDKRLLDAIFSEGERECALLAIVNEETVFEQITTE